MNKPKFKIEAGMVEVSYEQDFDMDQDGKTSGMVHGGFKIDAYELVTEIAKQDIAILELVLKAIPKIEG